MIISLKPLKPLPCYIESVLIYFITPTKTDFVTHEFNIANNVIYISKQKHKFFHRSRKMVIHFV